MFLTAICSLLNVEGAPRWDILPVHDLLAALATVGQTGHSLRAWLMVAYHVAPAPRQTLNSPDFPVVP